nr:aminopeptidase [Alicyclobacillus acidiphilus]
MGLLETSRKLLSQALAVKAGESVLIISDGTRPEICNDLHQAAQSLGAESMILTMKPRRRSGEEPPEVVAFAMQKADVVICPTEHSLTHTSARKRASEQGARVATMPGITLDMFENGPMTADFHQVADLSRRVADVLTKGDYVRIEKDGAILEFRLGTRLGIASTGMYTEKGQSGNMPSGEAYIAPLEGTANGELIVDGSMVGLGLLSSPIKLTIRDGLLTHAEGERADEWLDKLGSSPSARNVAEFGIGTNDKARLTGVILEDEKALGTIHVAFGSNATFGGTVEAGVHLDAVVTKPTVHLDGNLVMRDGGLMV